MDYNVTVDVYTYVENNIPANILAVHASDVVYRLLLK